ncbi:MAG: o-succinylbenzoate synthase, partial [Microbacteriaceae bacterium]|nr:o-succinylbenzoate synthase [Microbacteriaceae bacterium]
EAAAWLTAAIEFGWGDEPPLRRSRIPVNATVPAVRPDEVAGVLARFGGCRTAKVKVAEPGQRLADDIARVRAVRESVGPEGRIRVDANGAWNVDEAEHALRALSPFDLEYAEQPCARVPELAELRERVEDLAIPIAADESVRRAEDPVAVARSGAADLLVVKAAPLGGVLRAAALVADAGLPAVVSSAIDTSVGLGMGAQLAAVLPELPYDCGLGTAALLAADVTHEPLTPVDGWLEVRRVIPASDLLDRFAADPDRTAWWRDRIRRCWALLAR